MGVLAFRQEVNPHNNRIKKNERASRDDLLAFFSQKDVSLLRA